MPSQKKRRPIKVTMDLGELAKGAINLVWLPFLALVGGFMADVFENIPFIGYAIIYVICVIGLPLLAIIPALIARNKGREWTWWWIYGFLAFPIAFIHSIFLQVPTY